MPETSSTAAILVLALSHLENMCSRDVTEIESKFPVCMNDPKANLMQKKVFAKFFFKKKVIYKYNGADITKVPY